MTQIYQAGGCTEHSNACGDGGWNCLCGSFGMGLFRSTDKGQSWELLNRGLTDPFLLCLAVTPGQHVYAGTMRGGALSSFIKRGTVGIH